MNVPTETEVKLKLPSSGDWRGRLEAAGFRISALRQFEINITYDTAGRALRSSDMLLRLRQTGEKKILTWKGPGQAGPHKSRPELETSVGSLEILGQILTQLGFQPSFRYEKYRTEFTAPGSAGVISFDETPLGDFLELEGPGEWIDETARKLGFSPRDYILESYGRLYLADCERRGVEPTNMVYASHPQ